MSAIANDTEYQEGIVLNVTPGDGGYEVDWRQIDRPEDTHGWTCWCPDKGIEPRVGDTIRFWGRGIGYPFRGIALNGRTVFYETEAEQQVEWKRTEEERKRKQRAEYEDRREDFRQRIDALPDPFRDRLNGLRQRNPDFGWRFEAYELTVCEDAVKIATALQTPEAIDEWYEQSWDDQQRIVPGLFDGHSGNSFGAAVYLAKAMIVDPQAIPHIHGALCPLVGCQEYGCWATEAQR